MKDTRRAVGSTMLGGAMLVAATSGYALGFRNPDQDARATGQGEAFVAQADDPSAVYYNPSGLSQLNGTQITSGGYLDFSHASFKGSTFDNDQNAIAFVPHLYISTDFGLTNSPFRFALGYNIPFGDADHLGSSGPFRYEVTKSSLTVFNISPAVSYQVNDHLSLGAALNIYYGQTEADEAVNLSTYHLPDGQFRFKGSGDAIGATGGLMYKFLEQHTIGLVYRSPFRINFSGSAQLQAAVAQADSGPSPAQASIQFPQSVAAGYAFRPIPALKLEADIEWTDWASLNTTTLHSANAEFNGSKTAFNWLDSFYYEAGAQYDLNKTWVVRAGYIYSDNSVPNSTFSPSIPDSDRHVFSVGIGFNAGRIQMDGVYQFSYAPERTVSGSPDNGLSDGRWQTYGSLLMLTTTFKF